MREFNQKEYETIYKIAIAAYLHDIGKFAERADFNVSKKFLLDNADLYQPYIKTQKRHTHRHAIYTAAFIEYLEKYLPKPFNKGQWGLDDSFINLAAGHHKPETPLQWIIAIADRVSSGFDRNEFEDHYNTKTDITHYKRTRLVSIFELLSIEKHKRPEKLDDFKFRYALKELSPINLFPKDRDAVIPNDDDKAQTDYKNLFSKFCNALEGLEHKDNIPLWFEHFDSLFMIYGSCIPSATVGDVIPDISLYDHSRITSAIASAIYLYHLETDSLTIDKITDYSDKKFLIVSGDFYGIQDFIFSYGGSTGKESAKLLRGRSFAVSILSELTADMLCKRIGLPFPAIILNAAGKFTILAPNTSKIRDTVQQVESEVNNWLFNHYYGQVSIGISAHVEASCNDFVSKNFGDLWDKVSTAIEKKKFSKIDLEKYGGAITDYLDNFNNTLNSPLCPFCGKRPSSEQVENDRVLGDVKSSCKICRDHIYIGSRLTKKTKIAITTTDADLYGEGLSEPILGNYQLSFDVTGKLQKLSSTGKLIKYWDIATPTEGDIGNEGITVKFINGYVPKYSKEDNYDERLLSGKKRDKTKEELIEAIKEDHPKTFLHIAKTALNPAGENNKFTGIEALGVLKADVDHLGLIFSCGLKKEMQTLSRLAALSRNLNCYFSIFLPYTLSTNENFKNIYTVFGGGDDLFLIGPWNKIIEFSDFLNDSFKNYVCQNQDITLSTGISINKPDEPVRNLAEKSEQALKASKHKRNMISIFGETFTWDDFKELLQIKRTIKSWLDAQIINNAMLFRLNTFIEMRKKEEGLKNRKGHFSMEDLECLKWRSMHKYMSARNIGKKLKGEERKKIIVEISEQIAYWLETFGGALKVPLWWTIYDQRK
jgi:CRISPR-associated protein Csm1